MSIISIKLEKIIKTKAKQKKNDTNENYNDNNYTKKHSLKLGKT